MHHDDLMLSSINLQERNINMQECCLHQDWRDSLDDYPKKKRLERLLEFEASVLPNGLLQALYSCGI